MDAPDRARRTDATTGPGAEIPGAGSAAILALLIVALSSRDARANGAFPDSQSILTPGAHPGEITLVTNFGVVASQDGGQTWLWSCEQEANSLGYLYQYGAAPRNRLFAVANQQLIFSDDNSCGWQAAQGMVTGLGVSDFFPDPGNPDRVLAVAFDYGASTYSVLQSSDAGASFTARLFTGAPQAGIDGVEIARSDPRTVYVTTSAAMTNLPGLARSTDGGASWQVTDLSPTLGAGMARIVAVDPNDAQTILLLFKGTSQSLVLSHDGGRTVTVVLTTGGYFTSYTRTAAGTILVGGVDVSTNPVLFRSRDGGATLQPVPKPPPHIRALSTRGGQVFAATDNIADGYALGVSSDEGMTWQGVMSFSQVAAILGCLKTSCQMTCAAEVYVGLWDEGVCSADPPPPAPADAGTADGASSSSDAGGGGGLRADAGAPGGAAGGHGGSPPPGPGSHGCAVAPAAAPASPPWWLALALLATARARRRRSR